MVKSVCRSVVFVSVFFSLAAPAVVTADVLDDLKAERDVAVARRDHALVRDIERRVQAELLTRQSRPRVAPRPIVSHPGAGAPANLGPDVMIDGRSVRAFDTDYQMDGTMWAAFSTYEDTAYVYRSNDHGVSWQLVRYLHWVPEAPIQDIGLVIGEGDSAFIYVFLHSENNRGECWLERFDIDGQDPELLYVFTRPEAVTEFAVCRDYSGADYWLYAQVTGEHPDDWAFFLRSTDYGRNWAITDSFQGMQHPHVSASAGSHLYFATILPSADSVAVLVGTNPAYGAPGGWAYLAFFRDSAELGDVAVASNFTQPSESASIWVVWAEDSAPGGDWDIQYGWSNDGGGTWNQSGVLAGGLGQQRFPDLHNFTDPGNAWMNLSYISEDGFREVHRRHCHGDDPAGWSSPTVVNETSAGTGSAVIPRLVYSVGSPGTGAGCVFAGAGLNGLYWNAPWMGGVAEGAAAACPRRLLVTPCPARTHAAISWDGPAGTLTIHDRAGRVVRTFGDYAFGRLDWDLTADDGRRLVPGVYFCRMTAAGYRVTQKLVLQR
ncbi:hypothetical protein JXD38_03630 [candidate division WOR-3 bacterium]|nr:hypothetical protein [candidate division WOR-3 bacterium]